MAKKILQLQLSKHPETKNCEVCQEEGKSKTLKIQATNLINRVILPKNECWICELVFDNADHQIKHFSENHECTDCREYFDFKKTHCCKWKSESLMPEMDDPFEEEITKSTEAADENSEVHQSEQLPRTEIVTEFLTLILAKLSKDDSQRHSLKGRVRNALSTALKNIKRRLKCC